MDLSARIDEQDLISHITTIGIIQHVYKQRITKMLIRLRRCADSFPGLIYTFVVEFDIHSFMTAQLFYL